MRTPAKNAQPAWSAGRRWWPSRDWFLVLKMIGRENGLSFLNQSRDEVKQNKSNSELDPLLKPFCDWSRKHAPPSKPIRCWSLAFSRALGSVLVLLWAFTSYFYMASWFYDIKKIHVRKEIRLFMRRSVSQMESVIHRHKINLKTYLCCE